MPTPLPNLGAQRQLQKLGAVAKNVGPGLFSASQTPRPVNPNFTSMGIDATALGMPSGLGGFGGGISSPFGNLSMPSMIRPRGLGQQQTGTGPGGQPTTGGTSGGAVGSLGGEFAVLDQYDQYFQEAAAATGMPVNVLKAIAAVERGWEGTSVAGAQGIMQVMPFWGQDFGLNLQDPRQNILAGAKVLKSGMDQYGNMDMAIRSYLGFGTDAYGTTDQGYLQRVKGYLQQLDASGGSFGGGTVAPVNGMWGGNPVGNAFVQQALQYQGVPYVWGSIPGAGEDPRVTGWDCSGFTYFMSQKYGDGSIPMGSHYQYQYAQQTGKLFTDQGQLQPGDLVFINTGWQGGAGAEMNQAGHVGIYIGNGQMIHAANPSVGTIISPMSAYGGVLGYMHQSTSGGGGYTGGASTGTPYGGTTSGYSGSSGGYSLNQAIANFLAGWGR